MMIMTLIIIVAVTEVDRRRLLD